MDPISSNQLTQARSAAQGAATSAVEYGAAGNTLADELRKAISERYNSSPEAQRGADARAGFLTAGPDARVDVQNLVSGGAILSPAQQAQILAAKRASALVPVMAANTQDTAAFGTMEDLISAGTGAYNAEAQRQSGLAQLLQGQYSDLLTNFYKQLEENRTNEMAPLQKQLLQAQIAATGRSNNGGGSATDLEEVVGPDGKQYTFNPKTGQFTLAKNVGAGTPTLTVAQLKQQVAEDAKAGQYSLEQIYQAYPELPLSSVTDIYEANKPKNAIQNWWSNLRK